MKNKKLLVSVGIPTYNRPEGLRQTLEHITKQTYNNLEIIISDNCSPGQETECVSREFMKKDSRIQYFRQEKNKGGIFNFKFVLKKATGEYFMWAADDDEWDPIFIETCLKNIGENGSIMTGYDVLYRTRVERESRVMPILSANRSNFENAIVYLNRARPQMFYGLHRKNTILFILEDNVHDWYDCYFIYRQILEHNFVTIPDVLYTAGVDTEQYIYNPIIKKKGRLFVYLPFLKDCLNFTIRNKKLNIKEKIILTKNILKFTLQIFINYEHNYRPKIQIISAKIILRLIGKKREEH